MIVVSENRWKQFCEGMRRGDVGPFTQENIKFDENVLRAYYDGDSIVALMSVENKEWSFYINQDIIDATKYIYIPTQEEWELWNDPYNDDEYDVEAIIASREPVE